MLRFRQYLVHFKRLQGLFGVVLVILAGAAAKAAADPSTAPAEPQADAQFFGDVFLTHLGVEGRPETDPFVALRPILASSAHNIVNFEGVATAGFVALEAKTFLLQMPSTVGSILRRAGIDGVTLANNHSMDYGAAGLHDTLAILEDAAIQHAGAGSNLGEAERPILIPFAQGTLCIAAFSRTLPSSFWAKDARPGTAFASFDAVRRGIKSCKDHGFITVVAFHWGREGLPAPMPYQKELAHAAIDAGADAVIGHHPHVIQDVERYAGRPIFYSLGNAVFHTLPDSPPTGMAVRLLRSPPSDPLKWEIIFLAVDNHDVKFHPRPLPTESTLPPSFAGLLHDKICARGESNKLTCQFR